MNPLHNAEKEIQQTSNSKGVLGKHKDELKKEITMRDIDLEDNIKHEFYKAGSFNKDREVMSKERVLNLLNVAELKGIEFAEKTKNEEFAERIKRLSSTSEYYDKKMNCIHISPEHLLKELREVK